MITPEAKPLTPAEAKLLKWALGCLEEYFSDEGCNDFHLEFDAGLSADEWPEIARAINARRDELDQGAALAASSFTDVEVVSYLRHKLLGDRGNSP
jgi:hypothetical protein